MLAGLVRRGEEYTFSEGSGGSFPSAYMSVEVQDSSVPGVSKGDSVHVEVPMLGDITADRLASIDFGSQPWVFAVSRGDAYAGGNVTDIRDLDDEPNPQNVGTTGQISVFEVENEGQVNLPLIDGACTQE